jgi:hypothetical protein
MLSSIAYHLLNVARSATEALTYQIAAIAIVTTTVVVALITTIGSR